MSGDDWPGGYAPACDRNSAPILEVLRRELGDTETLLEIGSYTGQHACTLAPALRNLSWQTSDQAIYLDGLKQNLGIHGADNIQQPLALNVSTDVWPAEEYDAVFTANTLHIMSFDQVVDTFSGIGRVLDAHGMLLVYGPFNYNGEYTSDSNEQFDASLRTRDPDSGIRDFEAVNSLAMQEGLRLKEDYEMPANNRLLVWSR